MKPPKKSSLKYLLAVLILLQGFWGCAHGNTGKVVSDKTLSNGPQIPMDSQKDESLPPASDDDPFFEEDTGDDFFDDEPIGGASVDLAPEILVPDPLEPFNRLMFKVNDKLYFWGLKPLAQGYKAVTPLFFRKGVKNAFLNIGMPIRFVSSLLQLKIKGAGVELSRFIINTTVGIGGVWDPADKYLGLKPYKEDLGQTLGTYKIGNGFYIVWPFLGPSTLRDSVGMTGDMFLNPLYYVEPNELALGLGFWDTINGASFRIGDYESLKSASMDPYMMIRDFYIQHRKKLISE
ncbi:MAG: VacJ family lipoprotein [Proteobacteria bacterium]|nr:VacJ family lipoprotein [Pseudomonadota bacterium]